MRLKIFTAPTMTLAMQQVRDELGEDAIIVSSQRTPNGRGFRVTAALEAADPEPQEAAEDPGTDDIIEGIRHALVFHAVPGALIDRIMAPVSDMQAEAAVVTLAAALDASFAFAPLPDRPADRPFALVGAPGCGKTVAVAKLAARAVMSGLSVRVLSTDSVRAGGMDQLRAFTGVLDLELEAVDDPAELPNILAGDASSDLTLIDTPGTNPLDPSELERLRRTLGAADAEPLMVLPAGIDALESAELAETFAALGATRLIATRLDTARRLGGLLAAADAGSLMLSEASATPQIANGIAHLNPVSLARLLMPSGADAAVTAPAPAPSQPVTEAHP